MFNSGTSMCKRGLIELYFKTGYAYSIIVLILNNPYYALVIHNLGILGMGRMITLLR